MSSIFAVTVLKDNFKLLEKEAEQANLPIEKYIEKKILEGSLEFFLDYMRKKDTTLIFL